VSYWLVVKAVPGHDHLAVAGVTLAGFETFAPKTRVQVGARWKTTPLFSTCFFAGVEERWRAIERAIGVASVVKFGLTPALPRRGDRQADRPKRRRLRGPPRAAPAAAAESSRQAPRS
jgi:hypothetical protein